MLVFFNMNLYYDLILICPFCFIDFVNNSSMLLSVRSCCQSTSSRQQASQYPHLIKAEGRLPDWKWSTIGKRFPILCNRRLWLARFHQQHSWLKHGQQQFWISQKESKLRTDNRGSAMETELQRWGDAKKTAEKRKLRKNYRDGERKTRQDGVHIQYGQHKQRGLHSPAYVIRKVNNPSNIRVWQWLW